MGQPASRPDEWVTLSQHELEDKIRGGMLAQIIGNLNGLPHEFKYIDEPGSVERYTPSLPDGAFTDDDTDIEWVYVRAVAREQQSLLAPPAIADLWKRHINRKIYCANRYARQLMDVGLEPSWTGNIAFNPWSEFNISGQFLCESFGLMAPAMPQTAARTGLHYTRVAVDGEPVQATQLFTTMASLAFVEEDVDRLLDAGVAAIDPHSKIAEVVSQTRAIHQAHPDDWRAGRLAVKQRWQTHGGGIRDRNGYELNTASTVAALLYGKQDFVETLRIAFNFGWDADNNAATAATIIGVMKGRQWMDAQGWEIADVYRNTTRDDMPTNETLHSFEDALIQCARIVIREQGGEIPNDAQGPGVYRIPQQAPANVMPLATEEAQHAAALGEFLEQLDAGLAGPPEVAAGAAYLAMCLDQAERIAQEAPGTWKRAVAELQKHPRLLEVMATAPTTRGEEIRRAAIQGGLALPTRRE
jgi:hypothetical protein